MKKVLSFLTILLLVVFTAMSLMDVSADELKLRTAPIKTATFNYDFGAIRDGTATTVDVTVAGLESPGTTTRYHVLVFPPVDLASTTVTGYVPASNTVRILINNESGSDINLGNGKWEVWIIHN